MVKGLEREYLNHYSWMDRANTTVINILFAFLDLDDICKDIQEELSSKSLGVGFVTQSRQIEEFSEHRGYLLNYINDVLYDISDYLEDPLYKGFHEAMDIMATIDMTDGRTDNTIGLQVDVQVSGRGMSYTNKQKMSELTLEDFIGSRYQETDGNSYVRNTYNYKVDGFADLFAEDYAMFIQYGKLNPKESTLDDYLEGIVLKEFAHKKDSPFLIELLQQLSELTVVLPIYEAYAGKTFITKDNLTKREEGDKLISATVNAFTLGYGAIISKGGVSVGKLFASEIIAEVAVSSTVIGCEKAGVPSSVTFALALLAGAVSNKVLFKDYEIKIDDLDLEKLGKGGSDIVDDVIEGGSNSYGSYSPKIDTKVTVINKQELPNSLVKTFKDGNYRTVITNEDITVYRSFGHNAEAGGAFATSNPALNRIQTKVDSAILPEWKNTLKYEAEIVIPKGSTINIGRVEEQFTMSGARLAGDADQFLLPQNWDLNWIKSIREVKP